MTKNLSALQKRLIGAFFLGMVGLLFFEDIYNGGENQISTGIILLFSAGIIYELISLFFKPIHPFTLKKTIFFLISLGIYGTACYDLLGLIRSDTGMLILPLLLIAILTDTGAYFIGRRFGKHKLAPSVSPNKTWEGFFGGLAASSLLGFYLYSISLTGIGLVILGSILVQIGDLFESYIKRLNHKKDSGSLIFGHGGLLDRFDGFLFLFFCVLWIFKLGGLVL